MEKSHLRRTSQFETKSQWTESSAFIIRKRSMQSPSLLASHRAVSALPYLKIEGVIATDGSPEKESSPDSLTDSKGWRLMGSVLTVQNQYPWKVERSGDYSAALSNFKRLQVRREGAGAASSALPPRSIRTRLKALRKVPDPAVRRPGLRACPCGRFCGRCLGFLSED